METDSITLWIRRLTSEHDANAAHDLWQRYYSRLIRLARSHLRYSRRRVADEDDVVLNVFDSFYRGAMAGRFPDLKDREHLWKVLVTITVRKAIDQTRHWGREKRGGAVRGDSAFQCGDDSDATDGIDRIMGSEPTPEFAALVAEQCEQLLSQLDNKDLAIAEMRLENCTLAEIAQRMNCSLATVKRRLKTIREKWGGIDDQASEPK